MFLTFSKDIVVFYLNLIELLYLDIPYLKELINDKIKEAKDL